MKAILMHFQNHFSTLFTWIILFGDVSTVLSWIETDGAEVRAGVAVTVADDDDGAGTVLGAGMVALAVETFAGIALGDVSMDGVATGVVKSIGQSSVPAPFGNAALAVVATLVVAEDFEALLLLTPPGGSTLLTRLILT